MRYDSCRRLFAAGMTAAIVATAGLHAVAEGVAPIEIGSRLEPFFDRHLIDRLDGAALKLHSPVPREIVFRFDAPWEGSYSSYQSFVKDGDVLRTYYRGAQRLPNIRNPFEHMVTGVAESTNGIHWSGRRSDFTSSRARRTTTSSGGMRAPASSRAIAVASW